MTQERIPVERAALLARLVAAAERGDGPAANELGDLYREGGEGVRMSPMAAFRWYATGALAGHARCQNNLGACYEHGLGCKQSYRNAVSWYRKSAAQGEAYASSNLGYCYLYGHGVPLDRVLALAWFEKALREGDSRAAEMVTQLGGDLETRRGDCFGTHRHGHAVDAETETHAQAGPELPPQTRCKSIPGSSLSASCLETVLEGSSGPTAMRQDDSRDDKPPIFHATQAGQHFGIVGGMPAPRPKARLHLALDQEWLLAVHASRGTAPEEFDAETQVRYRAYLDSTGVTDEILDQRRQYTDLERRAWEKDDCFDLPEPGSPADESLQAALERMKAAAREQGRWPDGAG